MDVELEGVFEVRGLGHFACLHTADKEEMEKVRDGHAAKLDALAVTVADIAPRSLHANGAPRFGVFIVRFDQLVDLEEWKARRGTILTFDLA